MIISQSINSFAYNTAKTNPQTKYSQAEHNNLRDTQHSQSASPCCAYYTSNISFKGNNELKQLSPKERAELEKRLFFIVQNVPEQPLGDYTLQAIDKLLKNKLIKKNFNALESIPYIISYLNWGCEKENAECLLDFVDFLGSKNVKTVMQNEKINEQLGFILARGAIPEDIDAAKDFMLFLNENPEYLDKDIHFGEYIFGINEDVYDTLVSSVMSPYTYTMPAEAILADMARNKLNPYNLVGQKQKTTDTETKLETNQPKEIANDGNLKGFKRVGGQHKVIELLQNKIIFPQKYPELYKGVKPEKGAILYGPPGTGKTLLAEALAEECDRHFVKIGASDMTDKWVGSSEENWRNLFDDLKSHKSSILFIDEADSLCKARGGNDVYGDKELNQFLKLMSDLKSENSDVFVLLATNNIEAFDKAILRDGRFGTQIEVSPPQNEKEVEEIFDIHTEGLTLNKDVEEQKSKILKKMLDLHLTGAGIEGVVLNAHEEALNRTGMIEKMRNGTVSQNDINNFSVSQQDFVNALDKRQEKVKAKKIGF